jgi:hypothetical protein
MRFFTWLGLLALAAGAGTTGALLAQDKGTLVDIDGLQSRAPAHWKSEPTKSQFRFMQFTVPKVGNDPQDAEMIIFYFGPGGGGGTDENVKRWKGFFKPPAGKSIDDVTKIDKLKIGDVNAVYVDISGIYLEKFPPFAPNAKITERPDYRMIGVVFESPRGPYFFRLIGPAKTVAENKKGFDDWLKGFK